MYPIGRLTLIYLPLTKGNEEIIIMFRFHIQQLKMVKLYVKRDGNGELDGLTHQEMLVALLMILW